MPAPSHLCLHAGAREVTRDELDRIDAPPATESWFPLKHSVVVDTVGQALTQGGFLIQATTCAVSRNNARLFSTMDLAAPVGTGVSLAVGVRNSTDKSLPLGFCAGSRVFVCDNLAFRSKLLVRRKHTRNGQDRFQEAICRAVQSLQQFREVEAARIRHFEQTNLGDIAAEGLMLRSYEQGIISHRLLPGLIREWRAPSFEDFRPRTLWSLFNAFTTVLRKRQQSDPQRFAALTIRLQDLLSKETGAPASELPLATAV